MNIKENIISLYSLRFLNQVIPLLSMPYLVRVLEVDGFGRLAFVTAIMGYFILVADYGFNLSATRDISKSTGNSSVIRNIYSAVLSAKAVILTGQFILLSISLLFFDIKDPFLYLLSFLFMLTQTLFPTFFFQGVGAMKWITILNVSAKLSAVILIIMLVNSPGDILLVPLINSIFGIISFILAIILIRRKYKVSYMFPKVFELFLQFKLGWNIFSSNIYGGLYAGSGVVILGLIGGNAAAANYSLAEKLLQVMKGGYLPLIQALFPWFSRFVYSTERSIKVELLKKLSICLVVVAIGSILIGINSNLIVNVLFGKEYVLVSSIFSILLLIPVVDFMRNISGVLILVNLGEERLNRQITQIGACIGIACIYVLSLSYGGYGAAIGLVTTEIFISLLITFFAFKMIRIVK